MAQTGKGMGTAVAAATGKTLAQLKTICQYHGWNDNTTNGLAALTDFINHTIQILSTLARWPEYYKVDGSATFSAADDQETLDETNIIRVGTVIRSTRSSPLTEISLEEWLLKSKYNAGSGPPNEYALRKYTSSGLYKVDMYTYPKTAAEVVLYYTYQFGPTTLVNNSDTTDWPTDRVWLLAEALRARLAAIDRDVTGAALYSQDFTNKVNIAVTQARPSFMPIQAKPLETVMPGKWRLMDIEKTITS